LIGPFTVTGNEMSLVYAVHRELADEHLFDCRPSSLPCLERDGWKFLDVEKSGLRKWLSRFSMSVSMLLAWIVALAAFKALPPSDRQ